MGRIIAIDYGRKRTGLAVTDESQLIATGLTTVPSAQTIDFLTKYLSKEMVDLIVVGEPKQMNNLNSEAFLFVEPFIKKLQQAFPNMPIERMDERFTSKMAFRTMVDAGLKKKDRQRKELIDTISATIILQSYLENRSQLNKRKTGD